MWRGTFIIYSLAEEVKGTNKQGPLSGVPLRPLGGGKFGGESGAINQGALHRGPFTEGQRERETRMIMTHLWWELNTKIMAN